MSGLSELESAIEELRLKLYSCFIQENGKITPQVQVLSCLLDELISEYTLRRNKDAAK